MKPIAIAVAAIAFAFCFSVADRQRADDDLRSFYRDMLTAKFSDARKSVDEAVSLWPKNSRFYGWRAYCVAQFLPPQCGRTLRGRQQLQAKHAAAARGAIEDYGRALALNNRDSVALHNRAWLEHLLGDDASAGNDWRKAIAMDPDNAVFHVSYGMFLEESGDSAGAHTQYRGAIELLPAIADSPFFVRYGNQSATAADSVIRDAITGIETRLGQSRDPILEARLGKLYEHTGDFARSLKLLEESAEQLPNLPLVWVNLGDIYTRQGNSEKAMACYRKARALKPSLAALYLGMGTIELSSGAKEDAAENFRLAIAHWQRMNPISADHNNRLYGGPRQLIDDLLPTTLVWYTSPCEASRAWEGLSEVFPHNPDYARRVTTCEQIPAPHLSEELQ